MLRPAPRVVASYLGRRSMWAEQEQTRVSAASERKDYDRSCSRGIVRRRCSAAQHTSEHWIRGRHAEVGLRAAWGSGLNPSESSRMGRAYRAGDRAYLETRATSKQRPSFKTPQSPNTGSVTDRHRCYATSGIADLSLSMRPRKVKTRKLSCCCLEGRC